MTERPLSKVHKARAQSPSHTPNRLLNTLAEMLNAETDVRLGSLLGLTQHMISRIRSRTHSISGNTLIKIHDVTNLSIDGIRDLAGIKYMKHKSIE